MRITTFTYGVHNSSNEIINTYSSVEIDKVKVIEDRDFGDAEIYLKYQVNDSTPEFTVIIGSVTDGDVLQFDILVLDDVLTSSYTLRIEVWESDYEYDENQNDYLGDIEFTRNSPVNSSSWYGCEHSIGGNNLLQAQIYIVENVREEIITDTLTIDSPADITYTVGNTSVLLTWNSESDYPKWFTITRNDVIAKEGPWDGSAISTDVGALINGTYTFICTVNNTIGDSVSDTVVVMVVGEEETTTQTTTETASSLTTPGFMLFTVLALNLLFVYRKRKK